MKARFFRDSVLHDLRLNIDANKNHYTDKSTWVGKLFDSDKWSVESSLEWPDSLSLQLPDKIDGAFDLENTRTLYDALKHLTPSQAADERLWAYATHVDHWAYMRQRWRAEQYLKSDKFSNSIRERYFFSSNRARAGVRNGLARLWWYGYASYDEGRANPYELTAVLLKKLDVTQSLLERAFSLNRTLTKAVLAALLEREQAGEPFYEREPVRALAKHIVHIGGVTIVDMLSVDDVKQLVHKKIDELSAAPQP